MVTRYIPYSLPFPTAYPIPSSMQPNLLKERVIGQDEAVETLAAALMRARCGLKDADRPIASLLFVGPTGESGVLQIGGVPPGMYQG